MTGELTKTGEVMLAQVKSAEDFRGSFPEIFSNPKYVSIRTCVNNIGFEQTVVVIYKLMASVIKDAIEVVPANIKMFIDSVIENYPDVSFEDIIHFTKRMIRGEFIGKQIGESKDSLVTIKVFKYDLPTMCLMFQRHYSERLDAVEVLRQQQSQEQKRLDKELSPLHPQVLELFQIDNDFKGIYQTIENYCERENIEYNVFQVAYENLYDEQEREFTKEDFVTYMTSQFLVTQNKIIHHKGINNSEILLKIIRAAEANDVEELVSICKSLGLWMIPTKYYHAAKKIIFEGGEIKFRYDINQPILEVFAKFIPKFQEEEKSPLKQLFVIAMIFNFTLSINRFNKYNSKNE